MGKTSSLAVLLLVVGSLHAGDETGFVPIFNGEDLQGWDSKPGAWEIRDGEMWSTGASEERNWIIWRGGEPADFVLRLEFRWDHGNSGVQRTPSVEALGRDLSGRAGSTYGNLAWPLTKVVLAPLRTY